MSEDRKTSEWIIVTSIAAVTLQLIRLSVDLVQVASLPSSVSGDAVDGGMHGGGGGGGGGAMHGGNGGNSRYGSFDESSAGRHSKNNEESKEKVEEGQPLLTSSGISTRPPDDRNHRNFQQNIRVFSFLAAWLLLGAFFLVAFVQQSVGFPDQLLLASATVLGLEALLLQRDPPKERSNRFKRFLHLWTALLLWLEYVSIFYKTLESPKTWKDTVIVAAATIHLMLVVWDGCLAIPTPAAASTTTTPDAAHDEDHKPKLPAKAIYALLKPYFWPDATASSATANRLRAIATWFCVFGSKVCNLSSPLFLGWASTALAHQNYYDTMRYSVIYSVISWCGSTLKEGQSLVYLKVAQAAYVQLSTTAFRHLHSLSLDWHLRKKLGVVLRSTTRGIAACDTLMKVRSI